MVKPIQSFEEFEQIINGGKIVIIDFWATWCGPCKMISPTFEGLANDLKDNPNIEFYKVDIDEQELIAQTVGIKAMPTFAVYKDGVKVTEHVGANQGGLQALVKTHTPA